MPSRSTLRSVAAALAALALVGGCGDGGGGAASARFDDLHPALCRAAAEAEGGDLPAAKATFDDVHVGLHDLASAAQREDRAVAARLLEAKQRVEADLRADTLRDLVEPVGRAVEAAGGAAPDSCS